MQSIIQIGTLMCNRAGHDNRPIQLVCMKKGCQEPIPCCSKCISKEHKNHQNHDFVEISEVQEQDQQFLEYLNKLAKLTQSISQVCQSWKNEIENLVDRLRQAQQLGQNPTLTELSDYVRRVREKKAPQGQTKSIKERLTFLKQEANELIKSQANLQQNVNQQIVMKQEISNLDHLEFKLTQQLKGHKDKVNQVYISDDDKYLASSQTSTLSQTGLAILWDLKSNKQIAQYTPQFPMIFTLQFSKDARMLGVCSWYLMLGGCIEIYDLTNPKNTKAMIKLFANQDRITRITFDEDSNYLISVSSDQHLRVWDLKKNKEITESHCEDRIFGLAHSQEKQLVATVCANGLAYLFDCRTLNNLQVKVKWEAHSDSQCVEFIKSSTVLMTSGERETRFWQVDDLLKEKFNHFKEISDGGKTVKAYPIDDPQIIINCSFNEKFVCLWNYNSTELIQKLEIPDGLDVQSFAVTSDFKKIITGGSNKMVNIFEQQ